MWDSLGITSVLIVALLVLLWVEMPQGRRPGFFLYLIVLCARRAAFTADAHGALIAARFDWLTLPLTVAAVLECAWLMIREWPTRRHVAFFAACMALVGLATMRGVQLAWNVFPGQYVRPYLFAALLLGLLAVVGYAWACHHETSAYALLWLAYLGKQVIIGTWPYRTMSEWLTLYTVDRWIFAGIVIGWIFEAWSSRPRVSR